MSQLDGQLHVAYRLAPPVVVLVLPIAVTVWYRYKTFRKSREDQAAMWFGYLSLRRFIALTALAVWWAVWDLDGGWLGTLKLLPSRLSLLSQGNNQRLLFSIPVIASLFLLQILNYSTDKAVADLHWSHTAIARRAWWSVVQDVASMLMVATGFESIFVGRYSGILWIVGAALVHRVGMVFLRLAEGMRFNRLKSGALRNRSLSMARKMGIALDSVCMVPAGKGHLTNAYGGSRMIALTDALPKYLNEKQVDSVIAHELIHVKHNHARKGSLLVGASFFALVLLMFRIPAPVMRFRPLLDLGIAYVPIIAFYYFSRRAEFEADREAVLYTGDPEAAIRGLANLYQSARVPIHLSKLAEVFQTHPSLTRRVLTIAQVGEMPKDRLSKVLKEAGLIGVAFDATAEVPS